MLIDINAEIISGDKSGGISEFEFLLDKFDETLVSGIVQYFFSDKQIYENNGQATKSEIETNILQLKKLLSLNTNDSSKEAEGWNSPSEIQTGINEAIRYWEKLYQTAPDKPNGNQLDLADVSSLIGEKGLDIISHDKNYSNFKIIYAEENRDNKLEYSNFVVGYSYWEKKFPLEIAPRGLSLSVEEATQYIYDFLNNCNVKDFKIDGVFLSNKYPKVLASPDFFKSDEFLNTSNQCYVFRLTREVDFLTINDVFTNVGQSDFEGGKAYGPVFKQEYIEVLVDDTGIVALIWSNPIKVESERNFDMLPFNNIYSSFLNHMETISSGTHKGEYEITKIKLGYMEGIKKDSVSEGILLPVWDFYSSKRYNGDISENEDHAINYSVFTINAYNGDIINRGVGY